MLKKSYVLVLLLLLVSQLNTVVRARTKVVEVPVHEDTYVEAGYPEVPVYNQRNLYIGTDTWYAKGVTRVFVQPDYAVMQAYNILPEKIKQVKFYWYLYEKEGDADQSYRLMIYKVQEYVDIFTLTWANQPEVQYYYYCDISVEEGFKVCSVTNLIKQNYQDYLDSGVSKTFSLRLKYENKPALIFWSSECIYHPDVCNGDKRPFLRIEYEDNSVPSKPILKTPQSGAYLNAQEVEFSWNPAIDPEGDTLFYKVQVSKDANFYTIYKESQWLEGIHWQTSIARDGKYFWRVKVKDAYGNLNYSDIQNFVLDRTPPAVPVIVEIPPYLNNKNYVVEWYVPEVEDNLSYLLEWADNKEFIGAETSGWINKSEFNITFKKEGRYFIRVKAKDVLGNQSDWSKTSLVTIDWHKPNIREFSASKIVFNSNKHPSIYLRFKVSDLALNRVGIQVYTSSGQKIFEELRSQTDHLYVYWHPDKTLAEGYYFVYGLADDKTGHITRSNPITLLNDKTEPKIRLAGITEESWLNKKCFMFSYFVGDKSFSFVSVYLNNRLFKTFKQSNKIVSLCLRDGRYSIQLKAGDKAGNINWSDRRYFNVDTVPPAAPRIELNRVNSRYVRVKVRCESGSQLTVSVFNNKLYEGKCNRGQYVKNVPVVWTLPYRFTAYQKDKAGNISKVAEKVYRHKLWETVSSKVEGSKKRELPIGSCWIKYNTTQSRIESSACRLKIYGNKVYSTLAGKDYINTVSISAVPYVFVNTEYYKCKPFTFWDIRTWFGCVKQFVSRTRKKHLVYYMLDKNQARGSRKGNSWMYTWYSKYRPLQKLDLGFKAIVFLPRIGLIKKYLTKQFTVQYINNNKKYMPPLGWIFNNTNVMVSQWYGYTKYEHPHTGIDFAVYKRQIYAPANGKVVAVGYHMKNKCYGGGYYIGVRHSNRLYTFYFHLQNIKGVKKYQNIKRGQKLAISGNSGRYLCKPLAYHLHFEVRKCANYWCHTNPVPYVNVDWRKIKTATYGRYWGRLSGENPHPDY